ncbi:MAG: hypothetical protein ACJ8FH_02505 [Sphingomicrobium sp.]
MPLVVPEPLEPQEIVGTARWLAQAYDSGSDLARFVAMEAEDYRAASFLDDRMFQQQRDVRVWPWPAVEAAMGDTGRENARWIFHIGHVGSTLVARMLGELPGVLGVREPRILRDLALLPSDRREAMAPHVRRLMARTFAPDQRALVKTTSFVSEIAPLLVQTAGRAIFMFAGARSYIETILAGENSVKELHALAEFRGQRMVGRLPPMVTPTDAHRAAQAWACEMTALEGAAEAMPDRAIAWLDFDDFLARPGELLDEMAGYLGLDPGHDEVERIVSGPLMRRYSKDIAFEYSPDLRRELQREARAMHAADIESALAMLDDAGQSSGLLRRALDRSARRE